MGHPFLAADYFAPVRFDPAGPVLLLPGSRVGAVRRIFPAVLAGFVQSGAKEAAVIYPSQAIRAELVAARPPANVRMVSTGAPVAAAAVLTSSGTMSMHCALAGIPGAVTYRTDPVTYWLGRLLVKVAHLGIANILLNEAMYPEFIQGAATPEALAAEVRACLHDPARREVTAAQAARLRGLLSVPASGTAGDWLVRQV